MIIKFRNKRLLKAAEAASYCGVSLAVFKKEFSLTPVVYRHSNVQRYDIEDIDHEIDMLKGGAPREPTNWLDRIGK